MGWKTQIYGTANPALGQQTQLWGQQTQSSAGRGPLGARSRCRAAFPQGFPIPKPHPKGRGSRGPSSTHWLGVATAPESPRAGEGESTAPSAGAVLGVRAPSGGSLRLSERRTRGLVNIGHGTHRAR